MAYCDLVELKEYLGVTGTGDDLLLDALISSSQKIIDIHTGRTFEATTSTTRYFDSSSDVDGRMLYFDTDICVITTVTNGDGVVISAANYFTEPRNSAPYFAIKLKQSSAYQWEATTAGDNENAIAVLGKWAYSLTAPADVRHACIRLASFLYRQKDNAADLDRAVIAGNSTILPAQIPNDIRLILSPYRRLSR